jgi:hypothetical protein
MPEQSREQLIPNAEHKHRQEPHDVHVRVCGTVDYPIGFHGDGHSKHYSRGKPEEGSPDERLDVPIHICYSPIMKFTSGGGPIANATLLHE